MLKRDEKETSMRHDFAFLERRKKRERVTPKTDPRKHRKTQRKKYNVNNKKKKTKTKKKKDTTDE